jgi:ribosomal subunit interface protein
MSTEISGRNFEITPDIRQLLETKLSKIEEKLFDDVIETRVVLEVQKYRNICEIFMVGKDHDVKAVQESDTSMQDAINAKRSATITRMMARSSPSPRATRPRPAPRADSGFMWRLVPPHEQPEAVR